MKFYVLQGDEIQLLEESEIISLWKKRTLNGTDFVRTEKSGQWAPLAKLLSLPSSNPVSPENDESQSDKEKRSIADQPIYQKPIASIGDKSKSQDEQTAESIANSLEQPEAGPLRRASASQSLIGESVNSAKLRRVGVLLLLASLVGLWIGWKGLEEIEQVRRNNDIIVSEINSSNSRELADLDREISSIRTVEDKQAAVRHNTEAIAAARSRLAEIKLQKPTFWEKRRHRNLLYVFIAAAAIGSVVGIILIVRN